MTIRNIVLSITTAAALLAVAPTANAGADPYIGEMMTYPYTFCPRGWASAEGQLLAISTNTALFSLYGTTFGGDGRTTFGLPDLRGRTIVGIGTGPGLSTRTQGQKLGTETNTMTVAQMPTHTHRAGVQTYDDAANSPTPRKNSFGVAPGNVYVSDEAAPSGKFMHADTVLVENEGGNQSQNNMQPSLVLRSCVALTGQYPSRS